MGKVKVCLVQYQENVALGHYASRLVGQHYKVAMRMHGHKSVPVLKLPEMLLGRKTPTKKARSINLYSE